MKHLSIDKGKASFNVTDGMKKIQTRVGRMSAEFEGVDFQGINSGDMTPLYVSSFNALFSDFNLDYAIGFDGGLK